MEKLFFLANYIIGVVFCLSTVFGFMTCGGSCTAISEHYGQPWGLVSFLIWLVLGIIWFGIKEIYYRRYDDILL